MKNTIRQFILLAGITGSMLLYSCSGDKNSSDTMQHEHEHTYVCPMHPEVTGSKGDKCPKCGMELVPNDTAGSGTVYVMKYSSLPASIEAGKEATFILTPTIKGKESEPVPLDAMHEKKIHLIVVSKDLSWFEHVHPEYQPDGTYQARATFPAGGNYVLFADYNPSGAGPQLEKITVMVGGTPANETAYSDARTTWKQNGFELTLNPEGGEFITGQPLQITGILRQKDKKIDANSLGNYLGAKAHMVVVKTGSLEYVHVHPEVKNGNLDLHTTFEVPGIYRGWLQFQLNGKLYTSDFVFDVAQGVGNADTTPDDGHGHDHKDGDHHNH
jgi:hypothetical protein